MRTRAHLPSSHLIRNYFGAESSAQNCHLTDTQQHGRLPLTECLCSPKYTCSNRILNAIVFGDGDLRRWLDHKGRALMEGIHALIKRPQRALSPLLLSEDAVRRLQSMNQEVGTHQHQFLILDFPASVTVRNYFLWFITHPVLHHFSYRSPDKTDMHSKLYLCSIVLLVFNIASQNLL